MGRLLLRKWGMARKAIVSAEWNNLCKWHNTTSEQRQKSEPYPPLQRYTKAAEVTVILGVGEGEPGRNDQDKETRIARMPMSSSYFPCAGNSKSHFTGNNGALRCASFLNLLEGVILHYKHKQELQELMTLRLQRLYAFLLWHSKEKCLVFSLKGHPLN